MSTEPDEDFKEALLMVILMVIIVVEAVLTARWLLAVIN